MITHTTFRFRLIGLAILAGLSVVAAAQDQLSLDDALRLARERNGTIRSAEASLEASRSQERISFSAFLPTLTPDYSWSTSTSKFETGPSRGNRQNSTGDSLELALSYRIWDSGTRRLNYKSSQIDVQASELQLVQTLRSTLFSVHQSFLDALRAQELLRVSTEQSKRTEQLLDYTNERFRVGSGPKKDILQAEADLLNAKTNLLLAENRVDTTQASLKSVIGWEATDELPALVEETQIIPARDDLNLKSAYDTGLANRADLRGQRKRIEGIKVDLEATKLDAGLQWSIDANVRRGFSPNVFDRSTLSLQATYPLYDGRRSQETVKARRASLEAQLASLVQDEREAKAEIESVFKQHTQARKVYEAAQLALKAAQQNYDVALAGRELGKFNILEIQNAQVSLTTAEVNLVEALYDALISDVRLRLVLGETLPGEE